MVLSAATIIFRDENTRDNKDLIDYLRRNLAAAIRKGLLSFKFKIVKTSDFSELREQGIKKFPAMIISEHNYQTVPNIVAELQRRVKNNRVEAAVKTEDEIVNDYQMDAMYGKGVKKDADGKFVVSEDPDTDATEELKTAYAKELERRRNGSNWGAGTDLSDDRKPSRAPERVHDTEETPRQFQPPPRRDNVDDGPMADAKESLRRIGKHATGEDAQDDVMMSALLDRMDV